MALFIWLASPSLASWVPWKSWTCTPRCTKVSMMLASSSCNAPRGRVVSVVPLSVDIVKRSGWDCMLPVQLLPVLIPHTGHTSSFHFVSSIIVVSTHPSAPAARDAQVHVISKVRGLPNSANFEFSVFQKGWCTHAWWIHNDDRHL